MISKIVPAVAAVCFEAIFVLVFTKVALVIKIQRFVFSLQLVQLSRDNIVGLFACIGAFFIGFVLMLDQGKIKFAKGISQLDKKLILLLLRKLIEFKLGHEKELTDFPESRTSERGFTTFLVCLVILHSF